jgi:lipoprotein-anchoring transpeptidase ErfK/SrfK
MTAPAAALLFRREFPVEFFMTVKRCGAQFTPNALWISVRRQCLWHLASLEDSCVARPSRRFPDYSPRVRPYLCSTSRIGVGQAQGSNRTPLGLHRVAQKIGGGWPVGTVFKGRQPVGFTWKGYPNATITTRILWLEGLEPGLNRGGTVDSHARYIYIHGTSDEPALGRPASCGCIHLGADDLVPLFDRVPEGTLVWITDR